LLVAMATLSTRYTAIYSLFFGTRRVEVRFPQLLAERSIDLVKLHARYGFGAHLHPDIELSALQLAALEDAFDIVLECWLADKRFEFEHCAEVIMLFSDLGFEHDDPLLHICYETLEDAVDLKTWRSAIARVWPVAPAEKRVALAVAAMSRGLHTPDTAEEAVAREAHRVIEERQRDAELIIQESRLAGRQRADELRIEDFAA
jgi:hypothetical protein